jgi:hypothetical protein
MEGRSAARAQFLLNGVVYDGSVEAPSLPPKASKLAKVKTAQRQQMAPQPAQPAQRMAPMPQKKPLPPPAPATSRSGGADDGEDDVYGEDEDDDFSDDGDDEDGVGDALGTTPMGADSGGLWDQVENFLSRPAPSLGGSTAGSARLPSLGAGSHPDAMVARIRQERSELRRAGAQAQAAQPPLMPSATAHSKGGSLDQALLAEAMAYADSLRAQSTGSMAAGAAGRGAGGGAAMGAALGLGGGGHGRGGGGGGGSAPRRRQGGVAQGSGVRAVRGRAGQRQSAGKKAAKATGGNGGKSGKGAGGARRKPHPSSGSSGAGFSGGGMCMESGDMARDRCDYNALQANFEQGSELQALRAQLAQSQASLNKSKSKLVAEMRTGPAPGC